MRLSRLVFWLLAFSAPSAALAAAPPAPGGVTIKPLADVRARHELVSQDDRPRDAHALTVRIRAGAEAAKDGFTLLGEGEATLALVDRYNDLIADNGIEPYPVVADAENLELNRLQLSYQRDDSGVTIGRQRIIHDNARFVGNVGWRQNEQTFDAVRGRAAVGPFTLDASYAVAQRTIFGTDSPNERCLGDFVLLNGGMTSGGITAKGFVYLIDYDQRPAFSSQTWGLLAAGTLPLGAGRSVELTGSYARQSDYRSNPVDFEADYLAAQAAASIDGWKLVAGYEELGSDRGIAAVQTPLATLHAFNGWADMFLTTPQQGLRDHWLSVERKLGRSKLLPELNASLTYHAFESDRGGVDYGSEWDAQIGFRLLGLAALLKYARYRADRFAVDTDKFWAQLGWSL